MKLIFKNLWYLLNKLQQHKQTYQASLQSVKMCVCVLGYFLRGKVAPPLHHWYTHCQAIIPNSWVVLLYVSVSMTFWIHIELDDCYCLQQENGVFTDVKLNNRILMRQIIIKSECNFQCIYIFFIWSLLNN